MGHFQTEGGKPHKVAKCNMQILDGTGIVKDLAGRWTWYFNMTTD